MTPQPLPPALTRLATALELSSGFTLFFITGPRDHADSVYLRLHALGPEYELVRHRLVGEDSLDLIDTLAEARDERPRVVFVSGLERMATAVRRDVIERLNLLRDSWAPHPARIVFWLPSWALSEFRRIAPDLFDWRSGLIVLNDADLPVRDELDLLVWTCERHGGSRPLPVNSSQWAAVRRRFNRLPARAVLHGLDPAERHVLLRNLALCLARDAISAPTLPRGRADLDLDNVVLTQWARPSSTTGLARIPVRVRSQDAAGKFSEDRSPWHDLAAIADIPGRATGAALLATLAAEGRLIVLLDAFDRLNLAIGEAPRRWLEQLVEAVPSVKLLVATAGPPPRAFSTWTPTTIEHLGVVPFDDISTEGQFSEYDELTQLIHGLFPTQGDLNTLATYFLGPEAEELQLQGSPVRFVMACARRGLLDADFFAELVRMRPGHTAEINAMARVLVGP